jgi:hypothetical protein
MNDALTADLLAWCMILLLPAFAMVGPLRRDQGAVSAYLFVVFLHVAAAVVYVYVPGVLPPRGDAIVFHKTAVTLQTSLEWPFGLSSTLYKWCLAHVYSWVGPSWLFASIVTIYTFALSVIVLAKFMEMVDVQHGKGLVIFLFGALPTSVLYGSVPLREPFQVLFFMTACYALLRFRLTSNLAYLFVGISSAVLMGMLHKGLLIFAPFLVVLMLMMRVDVGAKRGSPHGRNWFHRLMAVSLAAGFIAAIPMAADQLQGLQGAQVLSAASGDGLAEYAAKHRSSDNIHQGRTAYGISLDTSTPVNFIYSMTVIFFYYLFMPFPWQIRNFLDIYAFSEVVLRVATFFAIFRMWRSKDRVHPHPDHQIDVLLKRRLAHLEMASRRRELVGKTFSPYLLGFKVAASGDAETAGKERGPGLLADQIRLTGQQRLIHFQSSLPDHYPINDDLVPGAHPHHIAFDQRFRGDNLLLTLPDHRNFRAVDQGNLVQLALGPYLLNSADQSIDQPQPNAGQSVAVATQRHQSYTEDEQDIVEQRKQICPGNIPIRAARPAGGIITQPLFPAGLRFAFS